MKKIEKRALLCLLLAGALLAGTVLFVGRFLVNGSSWASFLPVFSGQPATGRVLDRDGDVLTWVDEDGKRRYYDGATVREATLHAVGDAEGRIGTGALVAFADKLSGYNLLTGSYSPLGQGNDLYLTLDARYNYIAYQALNGRKGAVGVYNYKTGEILCMVSAPSFDPANPPDIQDGDERYDGVYLNRFLSGTFTPGSVYKTVTLAAAIENVPDLYDRTWTCTGSTTVGDGAVTCPYAHGEQDIYAALSNSCNGVFALLADELGEDVLAGRFKVCTPDQILEECHLLIEHLDVDPLHFTSNHASNYLPLKGGLPEDKEKFLKLLDEALAGKIRLRKTLNRGI